VGGIAGAATDGSCAPIPARPNRQSRYALTAAQALAPSLSTRSKPFTALGGMRHCEVRRNGYTTCHQYPHVTNNNRLPAAHHRRQSPPTDFF